MVLYCGGWLDASLGLERNQRWLTTEANNYNQASSQTETVEAMEMVMLHLSEAVVDEAVRSVGIQSSVGTQKSRKHRSRAEYKSYCWHKMYC